LVARSRHLGTSSMRSATQPQPRSRSGARRLRNSVPCNSQPMATPYSRQLGSTLESVGGPRRCASTRRQEARSPAVEGLRQSLGSGRPSRQKQQCLPLGALVKGVSRGRPSLGARVRLDARQESANASRSRTHDRGYPQPAPFPVPGRQRFQGDRQTGPSRPQVHNRRSRIPTSSAKRPSRSHLIDVHHRIPGERSCCPAG
jgi:hypothetical protein